MQAVYTGWPNDVCVTRKTVAGGDAKGNASVVQFKNI